MGQLLLVNPRKRRKAKRRTTSRRKKSYRRNPIAAYTPNPRRRRRVAKRRYRRNPIATRGIMSQVMDAATMAGGAVVSDLLVAKLPIPVDLKTGQMAPLVRAGVAIATGMVVEKGLRQRALGRKMAEGALVVIAHDVITKMVGPSLGLSAYDSLGRYDDLLLGMPSGNNLLAYEPNTMGEWQNAAPIAQSTSIPTYGESGDDY